MKWNGAMASVRFSLEHFYYGQLVHGGKPEGDPRLLAKSAGITDETVMAAIEQVNLPPLPNGSWAVIRGKFIPALMVQSQRGRAGQTVSHYIVMPPEVLRAMSGNLRAMQVLIESELPVYEQLSADILLPVELPQAGAISAEVQIDDILDLMTVTKNNLQTIEALLSAIVQGVQLVIINAPTTLSQRIRFIEGVLALLPPSTRFGVTFTTHSLSTKPVDAQIRFWGDSTPPDGTLVYNWDTASLSGRQLEDEYSHFIISQLRLDAELVIQQTQALTSIAAWRLKRGDRLAGSLAYASHRLKLDDAIFNKQPVEITDVAQTLTEDPTLTAPLRVAYTQHLLTFSMALGDMTHADPIAVLMRNNADLAKATLEQFKTALNEGDNAGLVYETLVGWLANPLGPEGEEWQHLAHNAALVHLERRVKARDFEAIHNLLMNLQQTSSGVAIKEAVPRIVDVLTPLIPEDTALAEKIFLLAVNYMDNTMFKRLLNSRMFVSRLPKPIGDLQAYLSDKTGEAKMGLLRNAAAIFAKADQPMVVLRLAELAMEEGHTDLLDTPTLGSILQAALSPDGATYRDTLLVLVRSFDGEALAELGNPGPRYLLQIRLALGEYRELAHEMIRHSRDLYPGDLQEKYVAMVQRLFAETPLPAAEAMKALDIIQEEGIKSVPYLVAATGALEASDWSPTMQEIAEDVTLTLFETPEYLEVITAESCLSLLKFHARLGDIKQTIQVASLVPTAAAHQGSSGLSIMSEMYKLMTFNSQSRLAGLELLRQYVREAEDREARQAVTHFGRDLGAEVRHSLQVTYIINQLMGGMDIVSYATALNQATEFLNGIAAVYADNKHTPSINGLTSELSGLAAHIPTPDRPVVGKSLLAIGKVCVQLGKQYRDKGPRNLNKQAEQLLVGKSNPASALDVLRVMGGYFARGKRAQLKLESATNVFGSSTTTQFRADIECVEELLTGALKAFPPDKPVKLKTEEIRNEMDSIWGNVPNEEQREIVRLLARDTQLCVELVDWIADKGDAKALEDSNLGQKLESRDQRPRSTLEMLRLIYGYFQK
jgi:hypothetical protein